MFLLPLAFTFIGILLDTISLFALLATLIRKRWYSGIPAIPLFFYLPAAAMAGFGVYPPRFSLAEVLIFLAGLCVFHILLHRWHDSLRIRLQSKDKPEQTA